MKNPEAHGEEAWLETGADWGAKAEQVARVEQMERQKKTMTEQAELETTMVELKQRTG